MGEQQRPEKDKRKTGNFSGGGTLYPHINIHQTRLQYRRIQNNTWPIYPQFTRPPLNHTKNSILLSARWTLLANIAVYRCCCL